MNRSSKLKTALVAVGSSLAVTPAAALELGEVKVHSTLGQPLRASIAYALAPNEAVADTCVSLLSGPTSSGLPSVSRVSMIVADGVIAITGSSIVREPLLSMRVNVNCPYTPRLTREYMLFVDPADIAPQSVNAALTTPMEAPVVTRRAVRRTVNREPIANATRYLVESGDSLSEIAQRIENRPVGLWPAVNAIFAANPDAFIDNDMNKLKAGSWLDIPDLGAGEPLSVTATVAQEQVLLEAAPEAAPEGTAYEPELQQPVVEAVPETMPIMEPAEPLVDLQPGDVIIPDTIIDAPVATSSQPNVPVAVIQPLAPEESSTNWLYWFIGGGLALIASLLLFGRFRDRFGSAPIGAAAAQPQRRRTDGAGDTQRIETMGEVDVEIGDDEPTAENLVLDADLEIGTGLQESTDVEVSEDFAFASTTELDLELPEEISSGAPDIRGETDIIPPLNIDPESILESEVMADGDEDDYDMSVIVDVTKMPNPEDVTERDLEAIEVPDDDDTLITGDYTVSQEVDYNILEQDYEDELTATQALNAEIQKAAEDLAVRMDDNDQEDTKEMSLASVHELDVTAQMRGRNDDDISDEDDTGLNPTVSIEAEDKTAEMPKGGKKAG